MEFFSTPICFLVQAVWGIARSDLGEIAVGRIFSRDTVERSLILEISGSGAWVAPAGLGVLSCVTEGADH